MIKYFTCFKQEVVGAAQLALSLVDTGVTGYSRLMNVAKPLEKAGLINTSGQKKGTRYVLTNAGITEAERILAEQQS